MLSTARHIVVSSEAAPAVELCPRPDTRPRTLRAVLSLCCLVMTAAPATAQMPGPGRPMAQQSQQWGNRGHVATAHGVATYGPGTIIPVQYAATPVAPLDARIESMPSGSTPLQVINRRSQLIKTRERVARISISDPSIVEVAQYNWNELALIGVGLGTTDVWLWMEGHVDPLMYAVTVVRDPSEDDARRFELGQLERKIQVLYPNSKVYLIPLSRKIIVRGQARDPQEAARIMQVVRDEVINQQGDLFGVNATTGISNVGTDAWDNFLSSYIVDELQVPGEFQVKVTVKVAELNRTQARHYGLDWTALINNGRHVVAQGFAAAAPNLTGLFENGEIAVALDTLASNGTAKVMAHSSLVVLSGDPASFLAGGEFAVPTAVGIGGVGVGTTTFRGYGTSLIVTPTVVDQDLFRLLINTELSALDAGTTVGGVPGLNSKRIQTRVELREGQTIVLGGLFSRQQRADVTRIPWLGDLPVVGPYIFSRKQATEDENELLIVVTPELVRPMDADEVPPMPGWYVTHPDDFDFCKFNRTEGNPDMGHYQLLPYGNGQGYAQDAGYQFYNPAPVDQQIHPAPYSGMGGGYAGGQIMTPQHATPQAAPGYAPQQGYPPQPGYAPEQVPYQADPNYGQPQYQNQMPGQPQMTPPPQLQPAPATSQNTLRRGTQIQQTGAEEVEELPAPPEERGFFDRLRGR